MQGSLTALKAAPKMTAYKHTSPARKCRSNNVIIAGKNTPKIFVQSGLRFKVHWNSQKVTTFLWSDFQLVINGNYGPISLTFHTPVYLRSPMRNFAGLYGLKNCDVAIRSWEFLMLLCSRLDTISRIHGQTDGHCRISIVSSVCWCAIITHISVDTYINGYSVTHYNIQLLIFRIGMKSPAVIQRLS